MSVSRHGFSRQTTTRSPRASLRSGRHLPLDIHVERDGHAVVVQLFGEFAVTSCSVFERRLASVRRRPSSWLIVDLSGLDLVDLSGIRALVRLERDERRLLLLRGPQSVHQDFVDLGLAEALPFID